MISQKIIIISSLIGLLLLLTVGCDEKEEPSSIPTTICKIVSPENGEQITKGDTVLVTVEINQEHRSAYDVEMYIDTSNKTFDRYEQCEYDWATEFETSGIHTIEARSIGPRQSIATNKISVELIPKPGAPVAAFSASPVSGDVPLTVSFTDQSSNNPTSWQWSINGTISNTTQNPSLTFQCEGEYNVTLIVSNEIGSDILSKTDYIHVIGHDGTGESCPGLPSIEWMGQTYNTVLIGDQCWFRENLNAGIKIDTGENQQNNNTIEKYCFYNNPANCETYGGLYQWDEMMQYTTEEGTQGICPDGWHIPDKDDWEEMTYYLGGSCVAGGKMKVTGTDWWQDPNEGASNTSGFSALPRNNLSNNALIWSSTESEYNILSARMYRLSSSSATVSTMTLGLKEFGLSVRCLKD